MSAETSLSVRLLQLLVLPIIAAFIFVGIASYYAAYKEARQIYDAQLTHFASVLHELTEQEIAQKKTQLKRINTDVSPDLHAYEKNFAYRVWLNRELILYTSNSDSFGSLIETSGFTERLFEDHHWRFYVLHDGDISIEVAERYEVREELISHILGGIFLPHILIIPLITMVIWFGVARGIRPLNAISSVIRKRDPNNLEPIDAPVIPAEIVPVVDAINDLMKRTSHVLEHEKQFSNYAAHELRTPLAALKTQLQVALRTKDPKKADRMLHEALPTIERMNMLIEKLLTFVRVQQSDQVFAPVDISSLCKENAQETAAYALSLKRTLECDIQDGLCIEGERSMLLAMLRNLLENALKYTHEDGYVLLSLSQHDGHVILTVKDDGIGLNHAEQEKLFDSFYRAADFHAEGSGLGLAIVKWVADAHHATIATKKGLGGEGVTFEVSFPAWSLSDTDNASVETTAQR